MSIRDDLATRLAQAGSAIAWEPDDDAYLLADAVLDWLGRRAPKLLAVVADEDDEDEPPCPRCGGEPDDPTLHTEDCPTLGTCGQTDPEMDPPWHRDEEWWDGEESYSVAYRRHVETSHRRKP